MSLRLTPKIFLSILAGLLLAVLAFSQAAASSGLELNNFRPLGGSFFSWRNAQRALAIDIQNKNTTTDPTKLVISGQMGLKYAPLSARSLWMVGKGYEAQKDLDRARRAISRGEKITRRDAAIQLWLAEDAFRRSAIAEGLAHFDLMIRAEPATRDAILPQLAALIAAPEGRAYLQPYISIRNPWFPSLLTTAVNRLPKAEPIARLLIERRTNAPDLPGLESTYAKLVTRLVDEGAEDVALRVYPMLPNGRAEALDHISAVSNGRLVTGYPPFIWSLSNGAYGASLVSLGDNDGAIEFYGAPGTVGIAGSKLIDLRVVNELRWRVYERVPNLQSSAVWVATCLTGQSKGVQRTSINLLDKAVPLNKTQSMTLPANCNVARIDLQVAGGIGSIPASLIVSDLKLAKVAPLN